MPPTSVAKSTCWSTPSCSLRAGTRRAPPSACTSHRPRVVASTSSALVASCASIAARNPASSSISPRQPHRTQTARSLCTRCSTSIRSSRARSSLRDRRACAAVGAGCQRHWCARRHGSCPLRPIRCGVRRLFATTGRPSPSIACRSTSKSCGPNTRPSGPSRRTSKSWRVCSSRCHARRGWCSLPSARPRTGIVNCGSRRSAISLRADRGQTCSSRPCGSSSARRRGVRIVSRAHVHCCSRLAMALAKRPTTTSPPGPGDSQRRRAMRSSVASSPLSRAAAISSVACPAARATRRASRPRRSWRLPKSSRSMLVLPSSPVSARSTWVPSACSRTPGFACQPIHVRSLPPWAPTYHCRAASSARHARASQQPHSRARSCRRRSAPCQTRLRTRSRRSVGAVGSASARASRRRARRRSRLSMAKHQRPAR